MFTRRFALPLLVAIVLSTLGVAPAAAAKPVKPAPATAAERPLTPEEQAAADAKAAAADAYLAQQAASGADLVSLNCVTPAGGTDVSAPTGDAIADVTIQGCYVPQGFITVYARDQENGIYCGPAVGQVISNYAWAVASWANRYSQWQLGQWMGTNATGQTNALGMEAGLEAATGGAPRRPAGWNWVVQPMLDRNGNGDTGDELFSYLRTNVSGSAMPLAIPVKPHAWNARYWLSSWPNVVDSPGHWIAAYGWVGIYTGTNYARLYFADSSRDEGGGTGKYYNSVISVAWLIRNHTQRIVW